MDRRILRRSAPSADYTVSIEAGVICLVDHDNGSSVVNDAEAVVRELAEEGFAVNDMPVIYRDTNGTWDELVIINSQFAKFRTVNEKTLQAALKKFKNRSGKG